MWRHEDIWRTLGGGIDFMTGVPLADEMGAVPPGRWSRPGWSRLTAAPLIHGAAQVAMLAALFAGDTVVLLPHFDAHQVWRAVERHKVNLIFIVGDAMGRPLIEAYHAGRYDASSMLAISSSGRAVLAGGQGRLRRGAADGSSSPTRSAPPRPASRASAWSRAGDGAARGPTVTPRPEVIVLDDQGGLVGPGPGRLSWPGAGTSRSATTRTRPRPRRCWPRWTGSATPCPGDLARIEADGSVTLLGRGNTCVNSGGEKVFPEEVESALKSHPDVFDALVIGVADERLGQRVAALVQPREGRAPTRPRSRPTSAASS